MHNRSYIGDGVYASLDADGSVVLELEIRGKIILNAETFHALVEFIHRQKALFDPHCQLIEVPRPIYADVVKELRELEADVKPTLDS